MTAETDIHSEELAALAYLRTGSGELWRWSEGGEVLTWTANGSTLVFRAELLAILEGLSHRGLPPFPALVLLLAACRGHVPALDDLIGPAAAVADADRPDAEFARLTAFRGAFRHRCAEVLASVQKLGGWPPQLLTSARAKSALVEAVFERSNAWAYSPAQAREIIGGLRRGVLPEPNLNQLTGQRLEYVGVLQALSGLRDVTSDALAMRLQTGLDADIAPAPLPPEALPLPAELARQLLHELQRDPAHAALARAARDLLAALALPRRLPEPDDAASGGMADVANRGSLDKLLLSELANDDLTLAVRVALNEALYLRQEPPKAAQAVSLALLLDAGVRTWGVPRLFAAAAALALGAADARRPGLLAWRAEGEKIAPVDLLSAEGFRQHLGALTPEAQPGAALPAFFAALNSQADRDKPTKTRPDQEAVILTHRDALADPRFRRALEAQPTPPGVELFIATVDRDGRFELLATPLGNKPPVCAATIRLDDILHPPKPDLAAERTPAPAPLLDAASGEGLPLILSRLALPFRLPIRGKISASSVVSDGHTLAVTRNRCLFSWKDPEYGARFLAAGLPAGGTLMLQQEADSGLVYVLKDMRQKGRIPLSAYDPASGQLQTAWMAAAKSPVLAARVEGGVLLLYHHTRVEAFRLSDGEKLGSANSPAASYWAHGRYYRQMHQAASQWHFAAWDGLAVGFAQISGDVQAARALFDRTGRPGPWMLTTGGQVRHVETGGVIFSLGKPLDPKARIHVSRDGHHIYITPLKPAATQWIDLRSSRVTACHFALPPSARSGCEPPLSSPNYPMMNRFTAVCVLPAGGGLALRSARGHWWRYRIRPALGEFGLYKLEEVQHWLGLESRAQPFCKVKLPRGTPYQLKEACWPDGSRAFLDSRGLLHLKFKRSAEFSFALTGWPSALWVNDGRMAGEKFFLGPDQVGTPIENLLPALRALLESIQ